MKAAMLACLCVLFFSCAMVAPTYKVSISSDPVEGHEYIDLNPQRMAQINNVGDTVYTFRWSIGARRFKSPNRGSSYLLFVRYFGSDWFFIDDGESMIFNVDGEQIRLSGDGSRSNRDVFSGGTVIETAFYMTTYDKIERIVAGQMVYVKIVGSNQHATHIIPATVKSNIRRFLREHPPINADSLSIERKGAQPARRTHRPKKGSI